jgi:hypothetical protein
MIQVGSTWITILQDQVVGVQLDFSTYVVLEPHMLGQVLMHVVVDSLQVVAEDSAKRHPQGALGPLVVVMVVLQVVVDLISADHLHLYAHLVVLVQ